MTAETRLTQPRAKYAAPKRKKGTDDEEETEDNNAKKGDLELSAMVAGLKRKKVATV